MARHRLLAVVLFAAGLVAGSIAYRRRAARRRERVDLYAGDGAMVSVSDGSPESGRLLAIARELIQLGG
jgi:hypothetical protein